MDADYFRDLSLAQPRIDADPPGIARLRLVADLAQEDQILLGHDKDITPN